MTSTNQHPVPVTDFDGTLTGHDFYIAEILADGAQP